MIKPHQCPVCEKPFQNDGQPGKSCFPFCSDRCRQVDFFRWSNGGYAIVEDIDPQMAELLQHDPDLHVERNDTSPDA